MECDSLKEVELLSGEKCIVVVKITTTNWYITLTRCAALTVQDSAFSNCKNLMSVSLQKAKMLGNSVFRQCNSLTAVSLMSAEVVGDYFFRECLKLVKFECTAKEVGDYAFWGCVVLKEVDLPEAEKVRL